MILVCDYVRAIADSYLYLALLIPQADTESLHVNLEWPDVSSGFALGWGPTPWLVMSEIFPTRARGLGSSLCVLTNWSSAFIVTKTFHNLMVRGRDSDIVWKQISFI